MPKSSHFCDPGIDDTMALLLAFFIDEIEIVGIVADYGNVPKNGRRKCSFFNNETKNRNIKIFGGSERPLQVPHLRFYGCTWETGARSNYSKGECD